MSVNAPHALDVEPHHVPHGYVHPAEHHHWWWYAGLAGTCAVLGLGGLLWWQFDHAEAPLCARTIDDTLTSPDGSMDLDIAHVSCLGGAEKQKIFLHKADGGSGHAVVSFDGETRLRVRWTSDNEVMISHKGGKVLTFEPTWGAVHIKYR